MKSFLCLTGMTLLCGCPFVDFPENSLSISPNPDDTWNISAEGVRLDRLITEWAKAAGHDFGMLPPETRDPIIHANFRDVTFEDGLSFVLEDYGLVLFNRENPPRILTYAQYSALPTITRQYAIPSQDVEFAMNLILQGLEHQGLRAESDVHNATLSFTGSWEEHDEVRSLVRDFGKAIPLPEYPKTRWPETPPYPIHPGILTNQVDDSPPPLIREGVEIQHVNAVKLAEQLDNWIELHSQEKIIPLITQNVLILVFPKEKMGPIKALIDYLDDPVWHVEKHAENR